MRILHKILMLVLASSFLNINAQNKENLEFIFKSNLFFDSERINKNSISFEKFQKLVDINISELSSEGFSDDYVFMILNLYDFEKFEYVENVSYSPKLTPDELDEFYIADNPYKYIKGYVLCVNLSNGRSYKLHGFNNNDFISFFRDLKEDRFIDYKYDYSLTIRKFLKDFKVEKVDFHCLYRANKAYKFDSECLGRMSGPLILCEY